MGDAASTTAADAAAVSSTLNAPHAIVNGASRLAGVDAQAKGDQGDQDEDENEQNSSNEVSDATQDDKDCTTAQLSAAKKKKKKKRKTSAQKKAAAQAAQQQALASAPAPAPVLKISRNKHMKGPWLQLPHEILESFLHVNCNDASSRTSRQITEARASAYAYADRSRYRSIPPPPAPINPAQLTEEEELRIPPAVDPAAFRGVIEIRRLVDEASELATRASSGLSAAALGNFQGGFGGDAFGGTGINGSSGNGRNPAMSPVRQHRLRALAVTKLAQAYMIDEIAASVCVMQSATGLDDLPSRVLKNEPDHVEAQYVHFFHEKIPSRTLAASTNTDVLDNLIARNPSRLEYFRTRGIVHGFKQDYSAAIRGYTQALQQSKAIRTAKQEHTDAHNGVRRKKGKGAKRKVKTGKPSDDQAAEDSAEDSQGKDLVDIVDQMPASTIGKEAGDDLDRQLLFHRGMSYFHWACKLLEDAALEIEGVEKPIGGLSNEGGELTLRNVGIVLTHEQEGLLGNATPEKAEQYKAEYNEPVFKDRVMLLLRRSLRDMERVLAYFPVWEAPPGSVMKEEFRYQNPKSTDKPLTFRGRRLIHHRALSNRCRHSDPRQADVVVSNGDKSAPPLLLTTYHPLLVEAHFTVLLTLLMLGDFTSLVTAHARTVRLMDYLEGYPIFLPARSLNQSEYAEIVERLALTWLRRRELSQGIQAPTGTEHDIAHHQGDLASLHHVLTFFTKEYVEALVEQAERDEQRLRDEIKARKAGLNSATAKLAITDGSISEPKSTDSDAGDKKTRATWAEERDKADAERRKIDPSYAVYNTARAEVAIAWLNAVVLPEKEAQEQASGGFTGGKGKGKASANGNANVPVASTSRLDANGFES
ncbi:hypothetical protein OIV83_002585 [Microbotryomycetes sp. JL201]|nr:hypothetical protein OIV83_002585 [Microbotryomycetes sp. JL201]